MTALRRTPLEDWIGTRMGQGRGGEFSRHQLRRHQLQKLQQTLAYAAVNSPFYRRRFAGRADFSGMSFTEFATLPFTTPRELCRDPLEFLCVSHTKVARVVTLRSSGTTGLPKRLFFTDADLELTIDFFQHGMSTLVQTGQRVLVLMPGEVPESVGDLLVKGLDRLAVEGIVHGPVRNPVKTIDEILDREVDCLVGIPVQVLSLVKHRKGACIPFGSIRSVLLSADYVPASLVQKIEQTWGCSVYQHYGMTEMGYGGGVECDAHKGYHLREADLFIEVVDPLSGEALPEDVVGEVVFTTLTRRGMPLIRYRTGDLARFLSQPCPCGSVLRRLDKVQGRKTNQIALTPQVQLSITALDEAIFALPEILDFRVELLPGNACSHLAVNLYCVTDRFSETERRVRRALTQIPEVREAVEKGILGIGPIRRSPEKWFNTGTVKRALIDRRRENSMQ